MRHTARVLLLIVVGLAAEARGDGKFFYRETVPPGIPYQRAFLLFHEGRETLILQSKYDLGPSSAPDSLGWVVPVPTVPDVASADADMVAACFKLASLQTQPHVWRISSLVPLLFCLSFVGGFAFMVVCAMRYPWARRHESSRATWSRQARRSALVTLVSFFLMGLFMPTLSLSRGSAGIDVVKAEKAGIYDVKVIRGDGAGPVLEWLKENGFAFGESDRQAFQGYVDRGWCFVTAKVAPAPGTDKDKIAFEGMAAPLILEFSSDRPIYPLALTATAGTETEILIYTFSDSKLACDDRLQLRRARWGDAEGSLRYLALQAQEENWPVLRNLPEQKMMLCKFKGRLTPAQMSRDLEFTPAPDNEPYQERMIVW